jgi:type II secretory pathway component GspD/PulD (secretin)
VFGVDLAPVATASGTAFVMAEASDARPPVVTGELYNQQTIKMIIPANANIEATTFLVDSRLLLDVLRVASNHPQTKQLCEEHLSHYQELIFSGNRDGTIQNILERAFSTLALNVQIRCLFPKVRHRQIEVR